MPSKNQVNNKEVLKDLEKNISPILVVNNSSLKPYVELFDYAPENIYQQPLGSLVGFFEIKEYSEDSAYVVNFLTSVMKKEYYINPKRPVTESLDSALHKVNLALSELAKHGNVQWLGKLNATICVLEKNNAHFSVAGSAKIFLYRRATLTDISEDLAADPTAPHPLKTFVNVSSGRLEKNDRLLITSEDIFHIFSSLDLKKNLQRFEGDKFIQFLKTALSNQMEMIASLVVEMSEQKAEAPIKTPSKKKTIANTNVFSQTTFAENAGNGLVIAATEESLDIINLPEPEVEYTDKKTGHIYVQGEVSQVSENPKMTLLMESAKEKMSEAWYLTKNETRRKLNIYKKQISKKLEQRRAEKEKLAQEREEEMERIRQEEELVQIENEKILAQQQETERILLEQQELERKEIETLELQQAQEIRRELEVQRNIQEKENIKEQRLQSSHSRKIVPKIETEEIEDNRELSFQEKLQLAVKEQQQRQAVIDLRTPQKTSDQKIEDFFKEKDQMFEDNDEEELSVPVHQQAELDALRKQERIDSLKRNTEQALEKTKQIASNLYLLAKNKTASSIEKRKADFHDENKPHISPRISKIKNNFSKFSTKQKVYAILFLALIFIVPFFIARSMNKPQQPVTNQLPEKTLTQADILSGEKNIKTSVASKTVLSKQNLISDVLVTNLGLIAFTKNSVFVLDENNQAKEFNAPQDKGSIVKAIYMNDLSLVLIITDQNKVISFSPISQKFTENNINISGKSSNSFFGTYLTYMYVLDPEASQIYRYPRADGGFGEKNSWLKNSTQLTKTSNLTIDDSIYVVDGKKITKFFKGEPQQLNLESSSTSINYDLVYTNLDSTSLYILDKLNSRIVIFSKDSGKILAQYHSENLSSSTALAVDEKNKTAFIVTSAGLISISLQ
ncbi:MAG: hypothetical protein ACD_5C00144G0001 [uncultured bacterium]|nr:MAG: hypothetical protein ACD_5C00144G0001 [uncultured bacterium]